MGDILRRLPLGWNVTVNRTKLGYTAVVSTDVGIIKCSKIDDNYFDLLQWIEDDIKRNPDHYK